MRDSLIQIRKLGPEDAGQLFELRLEGLRSFPHAFGASAEELEAKSPEARLEWLERATSAGGFLLGAFGEGGELLGMAGLARQTAVKARHIAWIWGFYVAKKAHGQGLARSLLGEILSRAGDAGDIEQIKLTVESGNERAIRLYSSCGFHRFGVEPRALKINGRYFDEDHMVCILES